MYRASSSCFPALCIAALVLASGTACVSPPPPIDSIDAEEVTVGENEAIRIAQAVILFDASGSMEARSHRFESAQNLASSFVMGMPEGPYETAVVTFGGGEPEISAFEPFDRDTVDSALYDAELATQSTDIPSALGEARQLLRGRSGRTAVILFSDGVAQRYGRTLDAGPSLAAARALAASVDGEVCFYTIQSGDDPSGTALMEGLAGVTPCGEHRNLEDIADPEQLFALQQDLFIEESLPAVSAPPPVVFVDDDNDGVEDGSDDCPGTPARASVNEVGCWVLDSYTFDTRAHEILPSQYPALDRVADVLKANPDLRIRIDGHTDSSGSAEFNQTLSERRAEAVRDYLEDVGIEGERLETRGFGMSDPVADNDSAEGMARNRRCQLTVLR